MKFQKQSYCNSIKENQSKNVGPHQIYLRRSFYTGICHIGYEKRKWSGSSISGRIMLGKQSDCMTRWKGMLKIKIICIIADADEVILDICKIGEAIEMEKQKWRETLTNHDKRKDEVA